MIPPHAYGTPSVFLLGTTIPNRKKNYPIRQCVPAGAFLLEIRSFKSCEVASHIRGDCRILRRYSGKIGNRYVARMPAQSSKVHLPGFASKEFGRSDRLAAVGRDWPPARHEMRQNR